MSFLTIKTAFGKKWQTKATQESLYYSQAFEDMKNNRIIIARRLAESRRGVGDYDPDINNPNPNYDPNSEEYDPKNPNTRRSGDEKFPDGYGELSQDVLLSSFVAAYTGTSPDKVNLHPLPNFPLPNWRIRYDGLGKLPFMKKIFSNVALSHGYRSTYSVGNYTTHPDFAQDLSGFSLNKLENNNFIPEYQIDVVSIKEDFSPLLGLDVTAKNSLSAKFEVKRSRGLSLSFANNQLTEMSSQDYVIGTGYTFKEVPIKIRAGGRTHNFQSDLKLRADFTIRDMITLIRKLDEGTEQVSSGNKTTSIRASADYRLNERFSLQLYYDQTINAPKLSTSYRTSGLGDG